MVRPDGTKEFPPVRIREAWSRCASEGWAFKVVSESEYKEQTVTTHTPRPTFYRTRTDSHGQACIVEEDTGRSVAVVYDADSDADILAAAPELLEALTLALRRIESDIYRWPVDDTGSVEHQSAKTAASICRAAIAKAMNGGAQ